MFKMLLAIVLVAVTSIVWLATRPAAPEPVAGDYRQALRVHPGSEVGIEAGLMGFAAVYEDLAHAETGKRIEWLYADPLYFNDSLKTFDSRLPLIEYMEATAALLNESTIKIDEVLRDGSDVFVSWTMTCSSGFPGGEIRSVSPGMTHLRFNAEGQVVLHQDFWQWAARFYCNLPMAGCALQPAGRCLSQ